MSFLDRLKESSWNPANGFNLASRYRNAAPGDQIRYAQTPPAVLRLQGGKKRIQYYRELEARLRTLAPDSVTGGVEAIMDARLSAARGCATDGLASEFREVQRLVAELNGMTNLQSPRNGWETRKRAREHIAVRLGSQAQYAAERGEIAAGLEGMRALERTGKMSAAHLRTYSFLLRSQAGAEDLNSLRIYIRCLEAHGWKSGIDPLLGDLQNLLSSKLHIQENTPRSEIAYRIPLIARIQAGGVNAFEWARNMGLALLLIDRPARAIEHLERACSLDDQSGESYFFLGRSLYADKKFDRAAKAFEEALRRHYPPSRIAAWNGLALAQSGEWEPAYNFFKTAEQDLAETPDPVFYVFWARASFRMGHRDEAQTLFQRALDLSQSSSDQGPNALLDRSRASHGLAICFLHIGDDRQALAILRQNMDSVATFAPASFLAGRILERLGDIEGALAGYRRAVALNPGEITYKLALGLLLDRNEIPEGLALLSEVAQAGHGGLEPMRRLAMGYRRSGKDYTAQQWFARLAKEDPNNFRPWELRYLATEATDLFNRREFGKSAALWDEIYKASGDPRARTNLGKALLYDGSSRLRSEWNLERDNVWQQLQRAHELAPCWQSRYLNALAKLVQGQFALSAAEFAELGSGPQSRSEVTFLHALARYLAGDESALSELAVSHDLPEFQNLGALVDLLQIQAAVHAGAFDAALQHVEAFVKRPDYRTVALPNRVQLNALVWTCVARIAQKSGRQRSRLQSFLAGLKENAQDFWLPAVSVGQVALEISNKRPGELRSETLDENQTLLFKALDSIPESERGYIKGNVAEFLCFRVEDAIARGNLVDAMAFLDRLRELEGNDSEYGTRLRNILERHLNRPSHEKAYALIRRDPEQARCIWREQLELNPDEYESLQHLATLSWSRAFDAGNTAVQLLKQCSGMKDTPARKKLQKESEDQFNAVIQYISEALDYFRRLYLDERYWELLRDKGQKLTTARNPFDEKEFDAWRAVALQEKAQFFVAFSVFVAGLDATLGPTVAKTALGKMRVCGLTAQTVEILADKFAKDYLGTDPTTILPEQFETVMAQAERVLKMDPENLAALEFVIRGHIHRAESSREEPGIVADRMAAAKPHALKLEKLGKDTAELRRERNRRDIADFFATLGLKLNRKGNEIVGELNAVAGFPGELIRRLRSSLEDSNDALGRAVRLDPAIKLRLPIEEARKHNDSLLIELGNH